MRRKLPAPAVFWNEIPRVLALVLLATAAFGCAGPSERTGSAVQAAVPLRVEGNRPYIELAFRRPDGSTRKARCLIDTGGGGFLLVEPLARELGLQWKKFKGDGGKEFGRPTTLPEAFVDDVPLELELDQVAVVLGTNDILRALLSSSAPGHAEGFIPGSVLARYHVVFDYPNATFTLARPGVLKPTGHPLPMPVHKQSGFPRTEVEVDGVTHGVLLDTGASFTMVSEVLLKSWGAKHPDWPRHRGAFGDAKTLGGETLETMFVPGAKWGPYKLDELGVTSQGEGTFEKYMSGMMAAPIVGSLAGNVLKQFRIELDYPNETLYLSLPPAKGDGSEGTARQ